MYNPRCPPFRCDTNLTDSERYVHQRTSDAPYPAALSIKCVIFLPPSCAWLMRFIIPSEQAGFKDQEELVM